VTEVSNTVLEIELFCHQILKVKIEVNFVVLLQIHSELNVRNFVRMRSDLAFLSYVI